MVWQANVVCAECHARLGGGVAANNSAPVGGKQGRWLLPAVVAAGLCAVAFAVAALALQSQYLATRRATLLAKKKTIRLHGGVSGGAWITLNNGSSHLMRGLKVEVMPRRVSGLPVARDRARTAKSSRLRMAKSRLKNDLLILKEEETPVKSDEATLKGDEAAMKSDDEAYAESYEAKVKRDGAKIKRDEANTRRDKGTVKSEVATMRRDEAAMKREDDTYMKGYEAKVEEDEAKLKTDDSKVESGEAMTMVKSDKERVAKWSAYGIPSHTAPPTDFLTLSKSLWRRCVGSTPLNTVAAASLKSAATGVHGTFKISGIKPGGYYLYAAFASTTMVQEWCIPFTVADGRITHVSLDSSNYLELWQK